VVTRVLEGLSFTEGPVWSPDASELIFSDIRLNREYAWNPTDGLRVLREGGGGANGHAFDTQGRLIVCEGEARRVVRIEADGSVTVLASSYEGVPLNAPNDVAVHPSGAIFFTDPNFGGKGSEHRQWIYRISPDGTLSQASTQSFNRPNGIAISPDAKTLYVNIGSDHMTLAWPLDESGRVAGPPRRFADGFDRGPDGMTVHLKTGVVFIALFWNNRRLPDEQGIVLFSADRKYKGSIPIPGTTTNCTFGPDGDTLWVTSAGALYRVDLGSDYAGQRIETTQWDFK
jgi:gluconolactonase